MWGYRAHMATLHNHGSVKEEKKHHNKQKLYYVTLTSQAGWNVLNKYDNYTDSLTDL